MFEKDESGTQTLHAGLLFLDGSEDEPRPGSRHRGVAEVRWYESPSTT